MPTHTQASADLGLAAGGSPGTPTVCIQACLAQLCCNSNLSDAVEFQAAAQVTQAGRSARQGSTEPQGAQWSSLQQTQSLPATPQEAQHQKLLRELASESVVVSACSWRTPRLEPLGSQLG